MPSLLALRKIKEGSVIGLCVAGALVCGVAALLLIQDPKVIGAAVQPALTETTGTLKDIHTTVITVKDLTAEIKKDYENNQDNMAANSEATTVLIKSLTESVMDARTQLFGGQACRPTAEKLGNGWAALNCQEVPGLFPQTSLLLSDARSWMIQLKTDTHDLLDAATTVLKSADEALRPLQNDLVKLGELEEQLKKEIETADKHAQITAEKIEKILDDTDKQLANPSIAAIVDNLNHTTYHLGEVMETTDVATRDLRKKIGRVKWVLQTIGNYLKGTIRIY